MGGSVFVNRDSLKIGRKAVEASKLDVVEASKGCLPIQYDAAWDYAPIPTEEGVKIIKGQADIFTDPGNSATVSAVAKVIIENIDLIVAKAVEKKKLRRFGE